MRTNAQWRLAKRPEGLFKESDFTWTTEPIERMNDNDVLVRTIYISMDPTNRVWATDIDQYMPPVEIGEVMRSAALGVIEDSRHPDFSPGDIVQGLWGWQEYAVIPGGEEIAVLPVVPGIPISAYMGALGASGITAYFGLLDIGKPKAGETLVVSAAAGSVGSVVGQIGKIKGCRVVGIAGSKEKCRWLTDDLGFDGAVNYKDKNLASELRTACPDGVDIYYDNVGGEITDAVLSLINIKARIVLCGLISQYNIKEPVPGPYNYSQILMKRARLEGFIVLDYMDRFMEAGAELWQWITDGKVKYKVDIHKGLKNAITIVNKLFDGSNDGKLLLEISKPPVFES